MGRVSLATLLVGWLACGPGNSAAVTKEPAPREDHPCAGVAKPVFDQCGCRPVQSAIRSRVDAFGFEQNVKKAASTCFNGNGGLGISEKYKVTLMACIERKVELDPELKKTMSKVIESAVSENNPEMEQAWIGCYQRVTGGPTSPAEPAGGDTSPAEPAAGDTTPAAPADGP